MFKNEEHKVYGKNIAELMKKTNNQLPFILTKSFEFLDRERALRSIGLFRLNGQKDEVSKLKHQLDDCNEDYEIPSNTDPHVVTTVIKKYLRSLPQPLIPYSYYNDFFKTSDIENEDQRCTQIKELLKKIPSEHYKVLKFIFEYMVRLCTLTGFVMLFLWIFGAQLFANLKFFGAKTFFMLRILQQMCSNTTQYTITIWNTNRYV